MGKESEQRRWRGSFLVFDDQPDLRSEIYLAWDEAGATVEIETDLLLAFERMRRGRFSIVFVPIAAAGRIGPPEDTAAEVMDRWAELHAPNYAGRFLYYGSKSEVNRMRQEAPSAPVIELPDRLGEHDIERSMDAMDDMIERIKRKFREGD